jgi:capsule biosynthesis phosphatase
VPGPGSPTEPTDESVHAQRAHSQETADRTLCVDIDDTLCFTTDHDYARSTPNEPVIAKLREAHAKGWRIVLHTARGMGRSGGNIATVTDQVLAEIEALCVRHTIPYDAI